MKLCMFVPAEVSSGLRSTTSFQDKSGDEWMNGSRDSMDVRITCLLIVLEEDTRWIKLSLARR
jgi:hypothetical protein